MIVVVMGVSRLRQDHGRRGARRGGSAGRFLDADDFHPPANVAKMAAGVPLTDDDRWPWLDRIADGDARDRRRAAGTPCSRARR